MRTALRWCVGILAAASLFVSIPRVVWAKQLYDLAVTYPNGRLVSVRVAASSPAAAVQYMVRQPGVVRVELNQRYQATVIPNDPNYPDQATLAQIAAPQAWDTVTDASTIIVAVLDSGVDTANPDLAANIWTNPGEIAGNGMDDDGNGYVDDVHGWNYVEGTNDARPQVTAGATVAGINHGTVIAGIIGAQGNNALAGTGVAWRVKILPVRVLDSTGSGTTVTVAQGIRYAIAEGARIINLSFVGTGTSLALQDAINAAYANGVLVVAAAGNTNDNLDTTPAYPICYSHVLGVASVNASDVKSSFSSYGSCVDVSAPGENIFSTLYYNPTAGYASVAGNGWYGTSVASPFVAGAAALTLAQSPNVNPDSLITLLKKSSVSIDAKNPSYVGGLGTGRLDLAALFTNVQTVLASSQNILVMPLRGDGPRVREYNPSGKLLAQFWSGDALSRLGSTVGSGDVYGDGTREIITANLSGGEPRVRVFNRSGKQLATFLAYGSLFRGGVVLAVGDVNGDGKAEIVTGTQTGVPQVRIFSANGKVLAQFFALAKDYRGGVRLAIADANGDGVNDVLVASATREPRVSIYTFTGKLIRSFLVFPTTYGKGVNIATGDVNGDGKTEIVVGELLGTTRVRTLTLAGKLLKEFVAFSKQATSGVQVTTGDVNADGIADIITGVGPGGPPEVRVWQKLGTQRLLAFLAFTKTSRTGVSVSSILVK